MTAPALRILRARAAGLGPDRLRAQVAVQRLAAAADVERLLPAGAILVVRRAQVAAPGRGAGRLAARLDDALRPLIARAARPALGFVPANAEAVLFADEAELLACMAAAYASGALAGQWWWAGLLNGRADAQAVASQWLDRPQAVAAALDRLERRGQAALVLRKLGEDFARRAARALVAAHAVPALALERLAPAVAPTDNAPTMADPPAPARATPPWRPFILSAETLALPPLLQWTAGLAVALRRAPAVARSAGFAEAAAAWWATLAEPGAEAMSPAPDMEHPWTPALTPGHPGETVPRGAASNAGERRAAPRVRFADGPEPDPAEATAPADMTHPADGEFASPAIDETSPQSPERPAPIARGTPLRTAHGGLLFLLNAALAMDLWGDFSAPRHRDLPIDPWTWLGEMGRRLLGEAVEADPIWPLLRGLAGEANFGLAPPQPAPRLLDAQLRTLKPRLRAALGVRDVRGVRRLLLRRPAELQLDATRLDASFDLATHPIAVRASGLDRDPGWIPAAGRDVRFHFR